MATYISNRFRSRAARTIGHLIPAVALSACAGHTAGRQSGANDVEREVGRLASAVRGLPPTYLEAVALLRQRTGYTPERESGCGVPAPAARTSCVLTRRVRGADFHLIIGRRVLDPTRWYAVSLQAFGARPLTAAAERRVLGAPTGRRPDGGAAWLRPDGTFYVAPSTTMQFVAAHATPPLDVATDLTLPRFPPADSVISRMARQSRQRFSPGSHYTHGAYVLIDTTVSLAGGRRHDYLEAAAVVTGSAFGDAALDEVVLELTRRGPNRALRPGDLTPALDSIGLAQVAPAVSRLVSRLTERGQAWLEADSGNFAFVLTHQRERTFDHYSLSVYRRATLNREALADRRRAYLKASEPESP